MWGVQDPRIRDRPRDRRSPTRAAELWRARAAAAAAAAAAPPPPTTTPRVIRAAARPRRGAQPGGIGVAHLSLALGSCPSSSLLWERWAIC